MKYSCVDQVLPSPFQKEQEIMKSPNPSQMASRRQGWRIWARLAGPGGRNYDSIHPPDPPSTLLWMIQWQIHAFYRSILVLLDLEAYRHGFLINYEFY